MKQNFPREERLRSRRLISLLMSEGRTFHLKPFRINWMSQPSLPGPPVQVMMSVPKYNFRKASQRNLLRRRMREAYRLNKQSLHERLTGAGHRLVFSVTYTAKEIVGPDVLQGKIIILLQRLIEENEKVTG